MSKSKSNITRRKFLKSATITGLLLPFSSALVAKQGNGTFFHNNPFVVPSLDRGIRKGKQVTYNLTIKSSQTSFFKGINTPTLGINQNYLGPVLRARRGDTVKINVTSNISDVTTLHWHGITLPANMDGGPHQSIYPGKTWNAQFKIRQDASTLWYHSHAMHKTGQQVYYGLAGMFIIDDDKSDQAGLPNQYGVDDIPCTIQDRRFNRDGSFSYLSSMPDRMMGMQGSTILVNGVVTPTLQAQSTLLRLRLHNGSNARTYHLVFSDGRPFHVIASDCGFLPRPFQTTGIRLAAAERVEILVDVSDKKQVMLKSLPSKDGMMGMMPSMPMMPAMPMMMNNSELNIMLIDARQAKSSKHKVPTILPISNKVLDPRTAVTTRKFELEMMMMGQGAMQGMMRGGHSMMGQGNKGDGLFRINGRTMDINRIDFQVKRNTTEIWEITNASPMAHPFHVHNVQFRVLDRNGQPPHPTETGLKDVVLVHAHEKVRIVMAFPEYSDTKVPYMYHCHILEHEDQGMMGQFTVV